MIVCVISKLSKFMLKSYIEGRVEFDLVLRDCLRSSNDIYHAKVTDCPIYLKTYTFSSSVFSPFLSASNFMISGENLGAYSDMDSKNSGSGILSLLNVLLYSIYFDYLIQF